MMKNFQRTLLFFLAIGISQSAAAQNLHIYGQTTEQEIRSEHPLFDLYTRRYSPDSLSVRYLSQLQDSVQIIVVLGTWCKDSKKHVPSLMKTLQLADNDYIQTQYIGVEYSTKDPTNAYQRYNLRANPTVIVYVNGYEAGRIVEEPVSSMEEDLVHILKTYQSSKK